MFYYPTVLKHRSGCFSTIWLVATKGIRVPRRDFLKVNVKSTCDDIMDYVLEQVPPPQPDLPRPRFSLYLSSQLQYGVIVVYHRQCAILLEEIHSIVGKLVKSRPSLAIDTDDQGAQALLLPDALALLEEAEGAQDPLFGVMDMRHAVPSPSALIQMGEEYLRGDSPRRPPVRSPTAAVAQDAITASPESITMREEEPVIIPIAEFEGAELVDQHPDTLDLLMDETDHFPEGDVAALREEVVPAEQETAAERERRELEDAQGLEHQAALDLLRDQADRFSQGVLDLLMEEVRPGEQEREMERERREDAELVHQRPPTLDLLVDEADHFPEVDVDILREEVRREEQERVAREFEDAELDEQHPETLDQLLSETDHFPEGDVETLRVEVEREGREGDRERGGTDELRGSTAELQPTILPPEGVTLIPPEETGLSEERPGPPPDQLTPVSAPALPSPLPAARGRESPTPELKVSPPEVKKTKRGKRQLLFIDPETQIPQDELQLQICNPLIELRQPTLPPAASRGSLSAAALLNRPCTFLPEELLSLWKQASTITPITDSDFHFGERGSESADSEMERASAMVEDADSVERPELSPTEVPRDMAESEILEISALDPLTLEGSDQKEVSREMSPLQTPEREGSPATRSVSTLQDIPEVVDEVEERTAAELPGTALVLFQSLLAPGVDRRTVSIIFQRLLENTSAKKLRVEQEEPYGDILIFPGDAYEEERTTV